MLKDLDKRNATAGGMQVQPLSGDVRSVMPARRTYRLLLVLLLTVFIIAGVVAWQKFLKPGANLAVLAPQVLASAVAVPITVKASPPAEAPPQAIDDAAPAVLEPAVPPPLVKNKSLPLLNAKDVDSETGNKIAAQNHITDMASIEAKVPTEKPLHTAEKQKREYPEKTVTKTPRETPLKIVSPQQASDNAYRHAVTIIQQGRVTEAKQSLIQALDYNPLNLNARQLLTGMLVEEGQQGEAITLLQDGLKIAPDQSQLSFMLARLQVEAGNNKAALATLQSGLPMAGNDPQYHALLATLLQREERHDEAMEHYLIALKADPAMPNWLIGIGISLQALGKVDDATKAFTRAQQSELLTSELALFVDQRLKQLKQ